MRIAVLQTCHNRKNKTKACLLSLCKIKTEHIIDIYVTDDGSTDGTAYMLMKEFPEIHLIIGDGNLFWSRGMYKAWMESLNYDYDFYLWLNDDVVLYPNFMDELLKSFKMLGGNAIVSGLIENEDKTEIIYGGYDKQKCIVGPNETPSQITFMNGNVVLVPMAIVDAIGIIDPVFHHDLGDVDYGLRALEAGFKIVATCNPVAYGYKNNYCRVRKWNSSILERLKQLYSPIGSNPSLNFYFRKRHFGFINAIGYWGYLHFINLLPDRMITVLFGNRYTDKAC